MNAYYEYYCFRVLLRTYGNSACQPKGWRTINFQVQIYENFLKQKIFLQKYLY